MRSRYSAFALKQLEYLWKTLHASHPDRLRPREEVLRALRASTTGPHYTGLRILAARDASAAHPAQVLFVARVFLKGKDVSFAERSDFVQEGAAWRYAGGELLEAGATGRALETLTFSDFPE